MTGGGGWQRSSYSGGSGESCVELAREGEQFLLRESDATPTAVLLTTAARLAALLTAARSGRFDGVSPPS